MNQTDDQLIVYTASTKTLRQRLLGWFKRSRRQWIWLLCGLFFVIPNAIFFFCKSVCFLLESLTLLPSSVLGGLVIFVVIVKIIHIFVMPASILVRLFRGVFKNRTIR